MIKILATDLDRTLIPNGKQKYDGSMDLFKKIIRKNNLKLVYITGRDIYLVKKAIKKHSLPIPDYVVGDVGASVFKFNKDVEKTKTDKGWTNIIDKKTPGWDVKEFKKSLRDLKGLKLQENSKQSEHKLSYYIDINKKNSILKEVEKRIKLLCSYVEIVYSEDYPEKRGLLDILPKIATKKGALEYLIKKLGIKKQEVVFSGDSGNDYSLLVSDHNAIIVKNASFELKRKVKKIRKKNKDLDRLYIAKNNKKKGLNGNYVSGIIQGLDYFGLEVV